MQTLVFGWYQESFTGVERESAYVLYAGYQKGGYQAGTEIELRVTSKLDNASKMLKLWINFYRFVRCYSHMHILSLLSPGYTSCARSFSSC